MFLLKQVRSISLQLPFKLWLLLCVSTLCDEVDGTPTAETVTKARCYANCLTKNPSANKREEPCQTQSCKDCLIPCEGAFADEITCKGGCNNINSCLESCEFLTKIKNFSSILAGDGSLPPSPSIPIVRNRTMTSILLEWVPVDNTSGSPVYLVEMDYSASRSIYLSEVSFSTNYTVTLQQLCIPIRRRIFGRSNYKTVFYKFRVAVLTENSSLAYGQQTQQTSLVKPNPVANVSVESFVYDAANAGDKVKLTASITPSNETQHLVTQLAMVVKPGQGCGPYFERSMETTGPQTSLSIHIYQRLMKCELILQAFSLISCSTSDPVTLRYTYPGCQHITDFPKSICYQFDPPEAPIEDRIVRNMRLEDPLAAQADFRFKGTVIWDLPLYPFKEVQNYVAKTMIESPTDPTGFAYVSHGSSQNPSYFLKDLLPGATYKIEVRVNFRDYLPSSAWNSVNITTPYVIPSEVAVRNLTMGSFLPSPGGGSFLVSISWQKPNFNYSSLSWYRISYKVGSRDDILANTNATHYLISGVLHGEMINYLVVPVYQHDWVKGRQVSGNEEAPVPLDADIKVKNIHVGPYVALNGTDTFFVNFSWTGPAFNFTFLSYDITYELTGYNSETSIVHNVEGPTFNLSGIRPKEFVTLKVTPVFENQYIKRIEEQETTTAPDPNPNSVKIQQIEYKEVNTSTLDQLDVLVYWQKPLFKESVVTKYTVTYSRTGNPDRDKVWNFETVETNFPVYDLIPGDIMEAEVTPEFAADVITGIPTKIIVSTPLPDFSEIQVRSLREGKFIEDEDSNTFSVIFSWETPSFKHSPVDSYTVSYEFFGGYSRDQLVCSPLVGNGKRCSQTEVNETFLRISGIFPREGITVKVTPVYSNKHIKGKVIESRITAPEPKEDLVKVVGLKYDKLVSGPNNTFGATLRWEKPLFTHSEVKHYIYKVMSANVPPVRRRRDANMNTGIETSHTNATISGIDRNDDVEFQVTPVFVVSAVTGKNEKIMLAWKEGSDKGAVSNRLPPSAIGGLIAGLLIVTLLIISLVVWNYINRQRRRLKRGIVSGKNALMIDEWEVDGDLVSLEEELGEGAFGKVYKGTLKEINTLPRKQSAIPPNALTKSTIKQSTGYTVAIKMLHGMADSEQRREFLEEIQLMKAVGSHKNIVNMVGCCTVEEPMFLLTEYVPYGDLLHYLRKRRGKVKEYLGDESRGPYRSTYCETYVIDGQMREGVSIKATRSDRIYVNTPDAPKADSKDIQILSFTQKKNEVEQLGTENKGMTEEEGESDNEEEEGGLTPGDLLAFAWQISQGMEYLARKGFVHRDLAARNVLVGEHKVAKVADFGLTRHVYEEKVYHAKRNRKLPLKWMSIEAIFDQTFTAQSDVWAFGVVLWELVTLGGTPYPTINNRELLRLLKGGYRMEKPDICNDEIYEMMTKCWMESPDERPNFTQIRERLEAMMQIDNPYLDFSVLDESRDYYNVPSFNSLEDETSDDEILERSEDGKDSKEHGDDTQWNELDTLSQGFKRLDKGDDNPFDFAFENNNLNGKDFRDLKDVKVNLDAIEMSLYRPGNRGLVL